MKDIIDGVELAPTIIRNADNWSSDEKSNEESSKTDEKLDITVDRDVKPQP